MAAPLILLVDDDAALRAMLRLSLKRAGFRVKACASGREALEELEREEADWLVTDGLAAPMDGFQLSAVAKARHPRLRIVMVSAAYGEADIAGLPIEKTFPKPVPIGALVDWLHG